MPQREPRDDLRPLPFPIAELVPRGSRFVQDFRVRHSVNDLWRRPSRNAPSRQLFADDEMRRRILGIKKGEYVCLSECPL